jgi:hypothetical protein
MENIVQSHMHPTPSGKRMSQGLDGRVHIAWPVTLSFGNIMLIARQKPDATNVAGLRTWNSLGRFVKREEKGIFILAPMVGRRSTKDVATDEPSVDATTEGQRTLYGFRAVYVFDRLSRDLRPSLCALDVIRECHFRKSPR